MSVSTMVPPATVVVARTRMLLYVPTTTRASREMAAKVVTAAALGTDMAELRLDHLSSFAPRRDLPVLLAQPRPLPAICVSRILDSGRWWSSSSMATAAKRRRGMLDLEAQFAFFRSQHRHPVNAAAHALLAWPILFTNLLILHFLPLPSPLDPALALALAYAAAYVAADRRAGALAGLLFLAGWAASRALAACLGFAVAWKVVLPTQLFCWTWQFLGHGLFEASFLPQSLSLKRGPSVSDLPEVFLMEPFLILLQILNKKFGYEPYPGFSKNVDKMEADLRESGELKQSKIT
ncbi:hypothetical protein E2562_033108 [Oryza meyeriana var. granulata]|uniref:DUF962 domain-containing protein n=1 Tax=Oryza meyeriana var. granulata TaxID=110450 RepID=A0A6G1CKB5_9ORYZ|nr:hypothetical protein E2562_033108 [Oryza meyeriana var. granulata]